MNPCIPSILKSEIANEEQPALPKSQNLVAVTVKKLNVGKNS